MKMIMEKYHQIMPWKMYIGSMRGQGGFANSMDGLIVMWLNGYFTNIWATNMVITWRQINMVVLLFVWGDQGNKTTMP